MLRLLDIVRGFAALFIGRTPLMRTDRLRAFRDGRLRHSKESRPTGSGRSAR